MLVGAGVQWTRGEKAEESPQLPLHPQLNRSWHWRGVGHVAWLFTGGFDFLVVFARRRAVSCFKGAVRFLSACCVVFIRARLFTWRAVRPALFITSK